MLDDWKPRGPRVLVKKLSEQEGSTIVFPEGVQPWPDRGVVVSVGPGYRMPDGKYVGLGLEPGDEVLFYARNGVEVQFDSERFVVLPEEHIFMSSSLSPDRESVEHS